MITVEQLITGNPKDILETGFDLIPHPWYNPNDLDKKKYSAGIVDENGMAKCKWVAVRGRGQDWALYHSLDIKLVERENYYFNEKHLLMSDMRIARLGTKIYDKELVQKFTNCSVTTLNKYRP